MREYHLSTRETTCLHWSSLGKTSWETGRILGVTERTVNFHISNACQKLGVNNRRAAVVIAVRKGLLPSITPDGQPTTQQTATKQHQQNHIVTRNQ